MATCELGGVQHDDNAGKSFALVQSKAWVSSPDHRVVYDIKWDAAVVPGGTHLGQAPNQASDWVIDKSPDGTPIGDRNDNNAPYFNNETEMIQDAKNGRYFQFNDSIEQSRLRGGSWWFRLKVLDKNDKVVSQSHDIEVNWGP
jgi:hypothetical protein